MARLCIRTHISLPFGLYTPARGEGRWAMNSAMLAADALSNRDEVLVENGGTCAVEEEFRAYRYNAKVTFIPEAEMLALLKEGGIDALICFLPPYCRGLFGKIKKKGVGCFSLPELHQASSLDKAVWLQPYRLPPRFTPEDPYISLLPLHWGEWQRKDRFRNQRIGITSRAPFSYCRPEQQLRSVQILEFLYSLHKQGVSKLRFFVTDYLKQAGPYPIISEALELISTIFLDSTIEHFSSDISYDKFEALLSECSITVGLRDSGCASHALSEGVCPLIVKDWGLSFYAGWQEEEESIENIAYRLLTDEDYYYSRLSRIQNVVPLYTHDIAVEKMKQVLIKLGL